MYSTGQEESSSLADAILFHRSIYTLPTYVPAGFVWYIRKYVTLGMGESSHSRDMDWIGFGLDWDVVDDTLC